MSLMPPIGGWVPHRSRAPTFSISGESVPDIVTWSYRTFEMCAPSLDVMPSPDLPAWVMVMSLKE
jgi:hypothetical protein